MGACGGQLAGCRAINSLHAVMGVWIDTSHLHTGPHHHHHAEARAAERRDGPVRVQAPLLKRTQEGQGRGGGAQGQARRSTATEAPLLPRVPGHTVWVSRGSRRHGSQKHTMEQFADVRAHGPDSGHSCAADGGTAARGLQASGTRRCRLSRPSRPYPAALFASLPRWWNNCVEVPTVLTLSSLQQTAEQIVDIPLPLGRGCRRQGFLPGQVLQCLVEQKHVDIPVPRRGGSGSGGPQVLPNR